MKIEPRGVACWQDDEAFEPMILNGLFAPGAECSAAARAWPSRTLPAGAIM